MSEYSTQPQSDEIEISLFGAGHAYGESILIHTLDGHWILIDSCADPVTSKPAAQAYLEDLYQDRWTQQIHYAIATHWHDDHIRGISSLIRQSTNCKQLVVSAALRSEELIAITGYDKVITGRLGSGITEIKNCISLTQNGGLSLVLAVQDRTLIDELSISGSIRKVISLAPSDDAVHEAQKHIASIYANILNGNSNRIAEPSPNQNSIVLEIQIGDNCILLGGDLENRNNNKLGWTSVLSSVIGGKVKSDVFKVPHHGSENAYSSGVWNKSLSTQPFALITPWRKGIRILPNEKGVELILNQTDQAFITSNPNAPVKIKKRSNTVNKILADFDFPIRSLDYNLGQIRLRKKVTDDDWRVELFRSALKLSDVKYYI